MRLLWIRLLSFVSVSSSLFGAARLPSGPSIVPRSVSRTMEYGQSIREYFSKEATEKTSIASTQPNTDASLKIKMESYYDGMGGWIIHFFFPEAVVYTDECKEGGLFIEFNQSFESLDLGKVQENLGYLIKRFANGYNTLFLVPQIPLNYSLEANGQILTLYLYPQEEAVVEPSRNLRIAAARRLIEERDYFPAYCALSPLLHEYPGHKDILVLLANLEGLLPRWQISAKILDYLGSLYPNDRDIRDFYFETITPHCSYITFQSDIKRTIDFAIEHYYWIRAEQLLHINECHALYLGEWYGLDRAHVSSRVNDQGESVGFLGNRSQSRIYLRNEWESGLQGTANIYFTEGVVFGAGLETSWLWPKLQGTFTLMADWHRPYWELFEAIASFGREDRLKFRVTSVENRWINWDFEGGAHRVGIRGVPNGFTSLLVTGNFFLNLFFPNPVISLNYSLDAEYVTHLKEEDGIEGPFNPVPLSSREFHTLRFDFIYQWRRYWNFSAFGGITKNRLGTSAATAGVNVQYVKPVPCGLEFNFGIFRYPSATTENADVDFISTSLTFRY
jgi:hypothetical protein